MKFTKDDIIDSIYHGIIIATTILICFLIYNYGQGHEVALFGVSIGAAAFEVLSFCSIAFFDRHRGAVAKCLSGIVIIIFANQLYDYKKLVELFPILNNIEPVFLVMIILGVVLAILFIIKLMMYIYSTADETATTQPANEKKSGLVEKNNGRWRTSNNFSQYSS